MISTWNKNNWMVIEEWIETDKLKKTDENIESDEWDESNLNQLIENFAKLNSEINDLDVILNNNLYKLQLLQLWDEWKGIDYSTHIEWNNTSIKEQAIIVHQLIESRELLNKQINIILDKIHNMVIELSWIDKNEIQQSSLNQRIKDLKDRL